MAKDKDRNRSVTPATSNEVPTPPSSEPAAGEPAQAPPATEGAESGAALMVSDPEAAALAEAHPDSLAHLIPVLPHKRDVLLTLHKVHPEEFHAVLDKLPPELGANFRELMDRMNPQRETREMGEPVFKPRSLRLYQGVGEKPKNPKLPKGGVEDNSGNMVLVPEAFKDDFEGVPQKLRVSLLFMAQGRAYWPARGPDGQPQLPPGLDIKGNQMICGSNDRVMGSRYGKCSDCPYKPSFDSKTKACKDSVDLFVVKPDLTAIFQLTLGATSFRTCSGVMTGKADSWKRDYMGQFDIEPLLVEKPGQSYYIWKAAPVTSRTEPNGVMNVGPVLDIMELMVRQIRTEVYFPRLASIYARVGAGEAAAAGSLGDVESAALGADYSGGGAGTSNNISV